MAETFNFDHPEQYTLSIRLSTDGFSFSVYDPLSEHSFYYVPYKIKRSVSMAVNVKEMLRLHEPLKLPYKRVRIYMANVLCLPVPFELFDEDEAETIYAQNCYAVGNNVLVRYNILPKANVAMLFAMEKTVYQLLNEQFPDARFYAAASPLVEYFTGRSYLGNSKKLYACLQGEHLTALAFDRGKLLLLNSFLYKCMDDCIYYLLNLWKQLDYDQKRDELHLAGTVSVKDGLVGELRNYLSQVYLIHPAAEFNRSAFSKAEEIPFDLQTSFLCDI